MKRLLLEFLGSLGYLLFGSIIELFTIYYLNISFMPFKFFIIAFGFAISFGVIYSLCNLFCEIDINVLFTFVKWLKNNISFYKMVSTIFMQVLGAVEAGLLILLFLPSLIDGLVIGVGDHILFSTDFNTIILTQFVVSFIFTIIYFVIKEKTQSKKVCGLILGICLFILLFISIPFTGGSVNPARGFVSNLFVNLAGALFSTIIYHTLFYHHNNVC